jgi:outer membrane protein, heavy metal efflux system
MSLRWLAGFTSFVVIGAAPAIARAEFPTLKEVIERARTRGPASLMAAADIRIAGATRYAAGLAPLTNPYLEVFVDKSRETQGLATVQANLWLPIELAGQRGKRINEVDSMVAWKQTAKSAAQANAVGEAVAAYGELLIAAARKQHAIDGEKIAREEAAYVKGRFDAKDATLVDKAQAEGEVARWITLKQEADLSYALAKARLAIATGDANLEDPKPTVSSELPALRFKDGDALAKYLVDNSPTLKQHEFEAKYFASSKEKWEADKYPPVNFIITAGRGDAGDLRLGGGLSWTFPVLRRNQGEISRAEADIDRAKGNYEIAKAAINARAKGFYIAYDVARKATNTIDTIAIPAAQAVVDASVASWKAGKIEQSRVFLARRDLATATERRLDIAAAGWRAYGDLAGLVGDTP